MRDRERERQRHRQREKQAPCRAPDMGLDPESPGSRPGLKAVLNRWANQAALLKFINYEVAKVFLSHVLLSFKSIIQNQAGHWGILSSRDTWVAQWLGVCLWLRLWSLGPGIESHIRVPHRAPFGEPASPSAHVSASLSVSLINK